FLLRTHLGLNFRIDIMLLSVDEQSRIIEMAWEDRTPFEAIEKQFSMSEPQVIKFMRQNLKSKSFKLWRKRVNGRSTKHVKLRSHDVTRSHCPTQYKHR
ncbi:MAG: hypothetical protein ACI9QV_001041, partial [Methylophagaceae bacterium]